LETPERRLVAIAVGALVFAMCFGGSFLPAFHKPTPHQVPVAVVASPSESHQIQNGLDDRLRAGISVRAYPSQLTARRAVLTRAVDGAFFAGGRPELLVTSAGGTATDQLLTQTFSELTAAGGQNLTVTDVVALPASNRDGLAEFFLTLSVLLPSLAAGVATGVATGGARAMTQISALLVSATAIGTTTVWIAAGVTGALPGHYAMLAIVAVLFSVAVSAPAAALGRIGAPGAALAALIFVIIGVPATGGPAGMERFLPEFFRALAPFLPPSVALAGLTNTAYFGSHDLNRDLCVLAAWAATGITSVWAAGRIDRRRQLRNT
jgi:hypothetical protein